MNFNYQRALEFDLNRSLEFSAGRQLAFAPNRDLGFGKRGRMFRGYVCSNCDAPVSPLDSECTECGAVFEIKSKPVKTVEKPVSKATSPNRFCTYCGSPVDETHTYCNKCGLRTRPPPGTQVKAGGKRPADSHAYDSVTLPRKKVMKAVKDWSETGKEFKDLVEK